MRGGKRPGAGRPPVSPAKREERREETKKQVAERRQTLVDLAGAYTEAALKTLAQIMRNPEATATARVAAATALLDRAHGKPPQSVEHSGEIKREYVVRMPARVGTIEEWQKRYAPQTEQPKDPSLN